MLGSKKTKLSTQGSDNVETIIGQHVLIHGDLSFSGGLYIEGRIIGKVVAEPGVESLLTLAQGGSIEGEIHVPKAVISGRLTGDIHSDQRIELTETAHIQGNIHYKLIEITAGATVSGQLIHETTQA
jgi:cytoskeletal protein CcmA (bactofilin family)